MISNSNIYLEEITEHDSHDLYICYSNQEAMRTFGREPITTKEEAIDIVEQNIKMKEEKTGVRYVARLSDTKDVADFITLKRYDAFHCRAEIDYLILPGYQGRGLGSMMLKLFLKNISQNWDVERVSAYIDLDNQASCKLLEKNHFTKEGILLSWVRDGDNYYDVYSYSFLLSDLSV
ncbi:GNAT family N-acetyltransferase [Gracilibacillus caseinilyticus]|uniref:GNAT family N-acetyltransferase n=1 Tax=Gracilibacillus caseinilyticus TaxID=2932256 RepID=A0ABY4F0V8_9BACI|nr:GNAT family N-acetyltransferase [Gracilibacillus caseinilyticus]UOQ50158.1 GNAT family N-acetyltransferase [Gracilibacillus caseinilyticus]